MRFMKHPVTLHGKLKRKMHKIYGMYLEKKKKKSWLWRLKIIWAKNLRQFFPIKNYVANILSFVDHIVLCHIHPYSFF